MLWTGVLHGFGFILGVFQRFPPFLEISGYPGHIAAAQESSHFLHGRVDALLKQGVRGFEHCCFRCFDFVLHGVIYVDVNVYDNVNTLVLNRLNDANTRSLTISPYHPRGPGSGS